MKIHPDYQKQLAALRRIEGQVRGLQKMVQDKRYCVDILTQLSSVNGAVLKVQDNILKKHLGSCVKNALKGKSDAERQTKIDEMFKLLKQFRKSV